MILIDSSAWIHFFNQTGHPIAGIVAELIRLDEAATCGLIVTEVLSGAEKKAEYSLLKKQFELLSHLNLEKKDYFAAGLLRSRLRMKGIRIKTVDTLIARLAIKSKTPLLHHDSDYNRIAKFSSLKIFPGSLV